MTSHSLEEALGFILALQSVLGVNRILRKSGKQVTLIKVYYRKIYSLTLFVVVITGTATSIWLKLISSDTEKKLIEWTCQGTNIILLILLFSVDVLWQRNLLADCLGQFDEILGYYSILFQTRCFKRVKQLSIFGIVVILVTHFVSVTSDSVSGYGLYTLIPDFGIMVNRFELLLMCLFTDIIIQLLKAVNDYLKRMNTQVFRNEASNTGSSRLMLCDRLNTSFHFDVSGNSACISILPNVLEIAIELCGILNQMFNFQVIQLLICTFLTSVNGIELILDLYMRDQLFSRAMMNFVLWMTCHLATITVACILNEKLVNEFRRLRVVITKLRLSPQMHPDVDTKLELLDKIIQQSNKGTFAVCQLFELRIALLPNFSNIVLSYIIVIIQLLVLECNVKA